MTPDRSNAETMQFAQQTSEEESNDLLTIDQSENPSESSIPAFLLSASLDKDYNREICSAALYDSMDPFATLAAPVIHEFESITCDPDSELTEEKFKSSELDRMEIFAENETTAAAVLFSPSDKTDNDPFSAIPLRQGEEINSLSNISEVVEDSFNSSSLLFTSPITNASEDPFQELIQNYAERELNFPDVSDLKVEITECEGSTITQNSESVLASTQIDSLQNNISPMFPVVRNSETLNDTNNASTAHPDEGNLQSISAKIYSNISSGFSPASMPFLKYGDNMTSQSFQSATAPGHGTHPSEKRDNVRRNSMTSPTNKMLSKKPNANASPASPATMRISSSRVLIEVKSVDELLENFWNTLRDDDLSYFGQSQTSSPHDFNIDDLPNEPRSLELLCRQRRCKSLMKKAKRILQDELESEQTLEAKSWYLAALIKEGFYDEAETVLHQFGDLRELQRRSHTLQLQTQTGRKCSNTYLIMRLRSLEATLCKYREDAEGYEKKLCTLIMEISNAILEKKTKQVFDVDEDEAELWLQVTQFTLIHHALHEQRYSLALRLCSTLRVEKIKTVPEQIIVLSRIGRIYMQLGDIESAEILFKHVSVLSEKLSSDEKQPGHPQVLMNKGLLLLSRDNIQEAIHTFRSILHLGLAEGKAQNDKWSNTILPDEDLMLEQGELICAAVNNYAICALYSCDVHGAVTMLERMIRLCPLRFLNEVVVFNLSSLYDLIYDNANSTNRKEMLKRIADLYNLEHIDAAAFRI